MLTYAFQIDHVIYEGPGKDGSPLTLVRAMREVYGVGNARVLRLDADGDYRVVVRNAGSSVEVQHAPSGRLLRRRLTERARRAWLADLAARSPHRVIARPIAA